jgi:CubicO group peptidase (beta-lactamase class C family)
MPKDLTRITYFALILPTCLAFTPTCGQVKSLYKDGNDCCGQDEKALSTDSVCTSADGSLSIDNLYADNLIVGTSIKTGKHSDHYASAIDDENKLDLYVAGSFKRYSEGDATSTPVFGALREQFFPYETDIVSSHGKRVMIESNMSSAIRERTGKSPLYALYSTTKPITAMTFLTLMESRWTIQNVFAKLQDPVSRFLPEFKASRHASMKVRKWDRSTRTSSFYTYADLNALGFLSVVTTSSGEHNIVSTLPNGNSVVIESNVETTDLTQLYPKLGVFTVATEYDEDYTLNATILSALPANTWGIYKDQSITSIDATSGRTMDTLQDKGGADRFKDDPLYAFTVIVQSGSTATIDGLNGLKKVVQFKIADQQRDITILDCAGHRTGHAYPFLGEYYSFPAFPRVYQQLALYSHFAREAFLSITFEEYGKVPYLNGAPSASVGFPKWMTTATFVHFMASTPTVAQPGEEFLYSLSYDIMATATNVIYEAYKHPTDFPTRDAYGYVDFSTAFGGSGYNKNTRLNETLYDAMSEFVFEPAGLTRDDVLVYFDTEFDESLNEVTSDPRVDRLVPQMDWYYTFAAANAFASLAGLPKWPNDRAYNMAHMWQFLDSIFGATTGGTLLSPAEGMHIPSHLWDAISAIYMFQSAGHTKSDGTLNPYYAGFKTYSSDKRDQFYGGGSGLIATAEAIETLLNIIINGGRKDDGTRVFSPSVINLMSRPLYTSAEDIADVSKFFDNGRGSSDGKTSIGFGFFITTDPDSKTLGNSFSPHGLACHSGFGGTRACFCGMTQTYIVEFTSTQFSNPFRGEDAGVYPGIEYLRQKQRMEFGRSLLDL